MMNIDQAQAYIRSLSNKDESLMKEMETYAKDHCVPIIETEALETLIQMLWLHDTKTVLEIGTAIGYSAIQMVRNKPDLYVTTMERNKKWYEEAQHFIRKAELEEKINLMFGDALQEHVPLDEIGPYDVLFIDAAKGQYKTFFEKYESNLKDNGLVICDNVFFKGHVFEPEQSPKRIRSMVKKVHDFNQWLSTRRDFHTRFLPVGDGLAVSKKIKTERR